MPVLNSFRVLVLFVVSVAVYFAVNDPAAQRARIKEAIRRSPVAYTPPPTQCNDIGRIALTFDNGISTTYTPQILDRLRSGNVSATFHVSTEWVGVSSLVDAILRRIVTEGHVLGFAWFSGYGADPRSLSESDLRRALADQAQKIYNAAGVFPRFVRFPYGKLNSAVDQVSLDMGFRSTYWNLDSADYKLCDADNTTVAEAYSVGFFRAQLDSFRLAGNLQSSFISLHTDLCPTASMMGKLFDVGQTYNYTFVTLDKCVGGSPYKGAASSSVAPPSTSGAVTPATSSPAAPKPSGTITQQSAAPARIVPSASVLLTSAAVLVVLGLTLGL